MDFKVFLLVKHYVHVYFNSSHDIINIRGKSRIKNGRISNEQKR